MYACSGSHHVLSVLLHTVWEVHALVGPHMCPSTGACSSSKKCHGQKGSGDSSSTITEHAFSMDTRELLDPPSLCLYVAIQDCNRADQID